MIAVLEVMLLKLRDVSTRGLNFFNVYMLFVKNNIEHSYIQPEIDVKLQLSIVDWHVLFSPLSVIYEHISKVFLRCTLHGHVDLCLNKLLNLNY